MRDEPIIAALGEDVREPLATLRDLFHRYDIGNARECAQCAAMIGGLGVLYDEGEFDDARTSSERSDDANTSSFSSAAAVGDSGGAERVGDVDLFFRGHRSRGPLRSVTERVPPTVGVCRLVCGHAVVHRISEPPCGVRRHRCVRCEQ